ncbi:MAG TPA: lysylphosphatidylglycerol synthase transmembrane domain-containing protein [Polyangiaceae bacterium]|nr:lysylphosphatidylglycerol synthase transmembrane domain-containing protein [Polyangiaceae bacterium]
MNRILRRLLAAMILGVLVYLGFALYRGMREIGESLAHFAWSAFFLACALAFGNYLVRFLKWEYYLARLEVHGIPKVDSLLTFLSGLVLTVTPGKVGEVFKSLVLFETHHVPVARTAPVVLAERLTDVLGIVILIVAGSAGLPGGLVWASLGSVLVLAILVVISSEGIFQWSLGLVERGPERVKKMAPKVREAWASLRTLTAPKTLIVPTLLSIVAWFLEGLALWVILHGFGESTNVLVACFFYATATLAGALIPVPGGLGVTEGTLEEQLRHFGGVSQFTSTSAMILVRFATLWFAVVVGFAALFLLRLRFPSLMKDAEAPSRRASEVRT